MRLGFVLGDMFLRNELSSDGMLSCDRLAPSDRFPRRFLQRVPPQALRAIESIGKLDFELGKLCKKYDEKPRCGITSIPYMLSSSIGLHLLIDVV